MLTNESKSLTPLRQLLEGIPPGVVEDTTDLERALMEAWEQIEGGEVEGMAGYKLLRRMEEVRWEPPVVSFLIERHGATAMGSTRAELHRWTVNVDAATAECVAVGFRQVRKRQAPIYTGPIADEIVEAVRERCEEDERIKWNDNGTFRLLIGMIFPSGSAVKQTLEGRRKRLRQDLRERLEPIGWHEERAHYWRKK